METNIWKIMWREIRYDRLAFAGLITLIVILAVVYIWAPFVDSDIFMQVNLRNRYLPWFSPGYLLGTDDAGRDLLDILMLSARNSFNIAFIVAIAGSVIGILVGLFSGFYGGHVDNAIMRILDFYLMIPAMMIVMVFVQILSPMSTFMFCVLLIFLMGWLDTARLIRIKALQQSTLDYVSASKTMGTPGVVIIFREMLPNLVSIITSNFTLTLAGFIGIETGLTFLGFGLPFGTPSLGQLIFFARNPFDMVNRMWLWLPAAILVILMMLCINFVGQALNRAADAKKRTI
ncbi:MAG: ABC transporter permease [Defluviitaleaceae bacterium]|nr:ABC transporter permease [Defluviitaleaceae bacterium]